MGAPILPTPNHFLGRTKIDTNYTGNLSANTRMILLTACGAGASGASRSSNVHTEGGGSGAHIIRYPIVVSGNDAVSVTIGIGGAAATTGNSAGNPGTSTIVSIGSYSFVVPGASGYQAATYMGLRARPNGTADEAYDAVCVDYINTTTGLIIDTKGYFWTGAAGRATTTGRGGNFMGVRGGAGVSSGWKYNGGASYFGQGGAGSDYYNPSMDGQGYGAGGGGSGGSSGGGGGGVVIIEEYM